MTVKSVIVIAMQVVVAGMLAMAGGGKLMGDSMSVFIFSEIGMEPTGRLMIGVIELSAAFMLLTKSFSAFGALLALSTMLGALIAHITILGTTVQDDGGMLLGMMVTVLTFSLVILAVRSNQFRRSK